MENIPLNLADLSPQEAVFTLSTKPGQTFTLCRWSLRIRVWASSKYTSQGLQEIFTKQMIEEIADMAWFMLKDKPAFNNSQDTFFDSIVNVQDNINVFKALLQTVGIGEPEIKNIEAAMPKGTPSPKPKAPAKKNKRTGAKSLTR